MNLNAMSLENELGDSNASARATRSLSGYSMPVDDFVLDNLSPLAQAAGSSEDTSQPAFELETAIQNEGSEFMSGDVTSNSEFVQEGDYFRIFHDGLTGECEISH